MASRVLLDVTVNLPELLHRFFSWWLQLDGNRKQKKLQFVCHESAYYLPDSIPATTMVWLLVFCKIDVNHQLRANGNQMLSKRKPWCTQHATPGFPLLCQGCHICRERGMHGHSVGKKRVMCYLTFYWFRNFWDQALAHLRQRLLISFRWEHFQDRSWGHSWEHHAPVQALSL